MFMIAGNTLQIAIKLVNVQLITEPILANYHVNVDPWTLASHSDSFPTKIIYNRPITELPHLLHYISWNIIYVMYFDKTS